MCSGDELGLDGGHDPHDVVVDTGDGDVEGDADVDGDVEAAEEEVSNIIIHAYADRQTRHRNFPAIPCL
jgi:hypothetical protein